VVRESVLLEVIGFAASVVSDPSDGVFLWKIATGGKAVGCLPGSPVPEILHAAGLLPIALESPEELSLVSGHIDAWLVGMDPSPFSIPSEGRPCFTFLCLPAESLEEALDRVEALAEWACAVSGSPASEGSLWRSIRAYAERQSLLDALEERLAGDPAFLTPREHRDIVRAGIVLPPEAHSRLLTSILSVDHVPAVLPAEGEKCDPLILLARRIIAG
jgi:hypothetical protein